MEYSSGCESGWTVYFEQSREYVSDDGCPNRPSTEEEDLSMVSDATSGPAQVSQDDHATRNCYMSNNNNNGVMFICSVSTDENAALGKKPRRRGRQAGRGGKAPDDDDRRQLDDTASSRPDFNCNYSSSMVTDFTHDHFSPSYFQAGASSTHYDQVHSHQPNHWYQRRV